MSNKKIVRKEKRVKNILLLIVIITVLLFLSDAILNAPPPLEEEYKQFHNSAFAFRVDRVSLSHGLMCLGEKNQEWHCLPGNEKIRVSAKDSIFKRVDCDTVWIFKYKLYQGYSQKFFEVIANKSPGKTGAF